MEKQREVLKTCHVLNFYGLFFIIPSFISGYWAWRNRDIFTTPFDRAHYQHLVKSFWMLISMTFFFVGTMFYGFKFLAVTYLPQDILTLFNLSPSVDGALGTVTFYIVGLLLSSTWYSIRAYKGYKKFLNNELPE